MWFWGSFITWQGVYKVGKFLPEQFKRMVPKHQRLIVISKRQTE
jgi:hypothetical protein